MGFDEFINIALPKGRLAEDTIKLLVDKYIAANCIDFRSRKLIFEDIENRIRFMIVRNMDVPTYVENGACHLGVVGKDILDELEPDVYEFLDLRFGYCRLCVAGLKSWDREYNHNLRIATKYPNITKQFFFKKGFFVETIKLYGSIELAPLVGLSDLIVDLVSTGETLKRNGLKEIETIMESTARLIANKNLSKVYFKRVKEIVEVLDD
ncbi:ATP phosphoribosyltransferase [Deferribacter abyssi]|uniref:ATP phosphoribosyltransferase n=1 Tax=Deferribacter abyssi TaxID=213806 RepID=UPI003C16BF36